MRFDLTDLHLFLQILDSGSITHGAAAAHMALPSASARVRGMEEALGAPLLRRSRRGVAPTTAGDALGHHARLVMGQIERMQTDLREHATGRKGPIRVLTNTAAMMEFLPERLAPYLVRHPRAAIDLKERPSQDIVKAVAGELADIGIIARAVDHGSLQLLPFAVDRLVAVVPRRHPLNGRRPLAFAALLAQPMVGLVAGNPLQDYVEEHALRAGHALTFRVRLRTFDAVCRMVEQGVGIAIMPETAAARGSAAMAVRTLALTDAWAARDLAVCVRDLQALPAHARELVDDLTGTAADGSAATDMRRARTPRRSRAR